MPSTYHHRGRSRNYGIAAVVCGALILSACSGSDDEATPDAATPTTEAVPATTEVVVVDGGLAEALDIDEGTEIVVADLGEVSEEPAPTTEAPAAQTAAAALVDAVAADTGIAVEAADGITFAALTDSTGAFTINVPSTWTTTSTDTNRSGGSFLVATSGSISEFYAGAPGIVVSTVSTSVGYTAEQQLGAEVDYYQRTGGCATRSEGHPYGDGTFTGTTVTLTDCTSDTSQVFIAVATDAPSPFSNIVFHVNVGSPADLAALGQAMASFTLL